MKLITLAQITQSPLNSSTWPYTCNSYLQLRSLNTPYTLQNHVKVMRDALLIPKPEQLEKSSKSNLSYIFQVTRATSTIIPKNDYRCEPVETSRNARPIFRKVVELSRWSQSYGKENDSDELAARGLLGGVAARGPIRKMPGRMAEHRAPLHGPYKCPSREKPVAVHQIRKPGLGIEPYYVCYKWPRPRLRGDARAAPAGGPTGR